MKRMVSLLISTLIAQPCLCALDPFANWGHSFATQNQNGLSDLVAETTSNATVEFSLHGDIFRRQTQCEDPGYLPCPNIPNVCCPAGDDCFSSVCCPTGTQPCGANRCYDPSKSHCCADRSTACPLGYDCVAGGCCPSGEQPCGSSNCYNPSTQKCCEKTGQIWGCSNSEECCSTRLCYDPDSEQCCDGGSCPDEDTCCTNECCRSIAYCAADGYCSPCPAAATTVTTTYDTTLFSTSTATITEATEPSEAAEFSCPPLTVTNSEGATLELGDDCLLTYSPPETTSSESPASPTQNALLLMGRQASCTPYTTVTKTITITDTITDLSTRTRTVFEETSDSGFSCPPMTITNSAGDELTLDESCALEFSLAETTSSSSSNNAPESGPTGLGLNAAVALGPSTAVSLQMAMVLPLLWILV